MQNGVSEHTLESNSTRSRKIAYETKRVRVRVRVRVKEHRKLETRETAICRAA
jgi:hypothetical protein